MTRRWAAVWVVSVLITGGLACGGGGVGTEDVGVADTGRDTILLQDTGDSGTTDLPTDRGPAEVRDPGTEVPTDLPPDGDVSTDVPPECPGNFLCPCNYASDCYSGICIETMDQNICTKQCGLGIDCPQGWTCDEVTVGGEKIYGCIYPFPNLCRPCETNEDCLPKTGAANKKFLCIESGPEGKFCGAQCDKNADCPENFVCVPVTTPTGDVKQCRPKDGQCPCTPKYEQREYLTTCYNQNEFGRCTGKRTCAEPCAAKTPAAETCNLEDDDCNGRVDDNVAPKPCPLTNAYGTCEGLAYCINGQQNQCQGAYPSPEVCNGLDDNCDGTTDEGFPDMDHDGLADCVDPDIDGDGVANAQDNCPLIANPSQSNNDAGEEGSTKIGDACDDDDDNDGVPDATDNCPTVKNVSQADADLDGKGDACDCDADNDGFPNNAALDMLGQKCPDPGASRDNCPLVANPLQEDTNRNGVGDACDCDIDGDTVPNNNPGCPTVDRPDNCRFVPNLDQADLDLDGTGDACDCDIDNDQVGNNNPGCPVLPVEDNCPTVVNPDQRNTDGLLPGGDGLGDACDCDIDADGVANDGPVCPPANPKDNCPTVPNPDQTNTTGGEFGDACNFDWDGDGVRNEEDNCPRQYNPEQYDVDLDGDGDACDCDADGDGLGNDGFRRDGTQCPVPNPKDNCLRIANPGQEDLDLDGIGDACDCDIDGDGDPQPNFDCPTPIPEDCDPYNPAISHLARERCNGFDDNCNGDIDEQDALGCQNFFYDFDNDGYGIDQSRCLCAGAGYFRALVSGDCNDNDNTINPGVQEVCNNGKDDNCNGSENDLNASGCTRYYKDQDGDGFGSAEFECRCYPVGAVYTSRFTGDCDDTDPQVNPNRTEICFNGKDDNCDGSQNDPNATNCQRFYWDADGDGWGTSEFQCRCYAEGNWRASEKVRSDCDDGDPEVYPERTEVCNNGKDDNCDGFQDTENASGCTVYFYDGDGDGYGVTGNQKCLCAPAPSSKYTARDGGDCQDSNASINPGVAEKCNGIDDNCDTRIDENPDSLCGALPNALSTCSGAQCVIKTCNAGFYNVNGVTSDGCECQQDSGDNTGNTCATAIDVGTLADDGTATVRYGRVVPDNDVDWYKVRATDSPDGGNLANPGRDRFNVVARLLSPTDGSLMVDIRKGTCGVAQSCGGVTWQWSVAGRWGTVGENPCVTPVADQGGLWTCCMPGECPQNTNSPPSDPCCAGNSVEGPGGSGTPCTDNTKNVRFCSDNTDTFYIRVYRAAGSATQCSQTDYALEISNGR